MKTTRRATLVSTLIRQLNEAVAAHRTGDFARAQALYETVLRSDPRQPDALNMLGLLAHQGGDQVRARALIEASIAARPRDGRAHYNLGIVCGSQGDTAGAIAAYESAIALVPAFAEAYSNLGNLYVQTGRRDDALHAYEAAIGAKPDFALGYVNLATVLIDLVRHDEAISVLEKARRLAPDLPEAHANLGQAYRRSGRFREALEPTRRAIELRPNYPAPYLNLALAACELDQFAVALEANARALEIDATSAEVHCNRARVFYMTGQYAEAIAAAEVAIALQPKYAEAHVNLAHSLLICAEFRRGWAEYPWIWQVAARRADYPYLDRVPLWNGESFAGRRLIITRDQGFGDAIQMVRYLPSVKARGGHVILEVSAALMPVFTGLAGVDELRIAGTESNFDESIDFQIPLLGLPGALETELASIPAPIPYLWADPERVDRWRSRIAAPARLRVGIAWAGSSGHANDHHRSVRLEDFATLGAIDGIAWYGLQKGRDDNRTSCAALSLDPLGPQIADFADAAAILTHLDLIIAVDTSIVHLAGAMGKPVWTLLPFAPDFRWLLDRSDSPWYPTMRLFRQARAGDWTPVFAQVAHELEAVIAVLRDT